MKTTAELFYEPRKILNNLSSKGRGAEMSERQSAFLCGLIKECRPKKILEIGVAAGGTTVVILNCISMLGLETEVISVDLAIDYYRNTNKKTGYLAEEYKTLTNDKTKHTLYVGKLAVELAASIGEDVDFVILDTMHSLPGELLDFLVVYPYLKKGAVIVLHDILLNHIGDNADKFAPKILLDTVVAEKIVDIDDEGKFSNIGAFKINGDTGKYIGNVFSALTLTWNYFPNDRVLQLYREFFSRHYTAEELTIYDLAVELNQQTLHRNMSVFIKVYKWLENVRHKNVYIYGFGNFGKQFHYMLSKCGIDIKGYIVSDGQEIHNGANNVHYLSEVNLNKEKDIILVGVQPAFQLEICENLQKYGIDEYVLPVDDVFEYMDKKGGN